MKRLAVGGKNPLYDFTLIDDEDYENVSQYSWHDNGSGYVMGWIKTQLNHILLSRFIMAPVPKKKQVDHINHNTYDNRRSNLRIVTPKENTQSRKAIKVPLGFVTLKVAAKRLYYDNPKSIYHLFETGELRRCKMSWMVFVNKKDVELLRQKIMWDCNNKRIYRKKMMKIPSFIVLAQR